MKRRYIYLAILIILTTAAITSAWSWYLDFREADKSLINVKDRGVLIVGSDIPYGVMEFFDENNQSVGVDVDIVKHIAEHLKVDLEFRDYDWEELFAKVKSGEVDLAISSITITPPRQKELLFSDPYFSGGQVIVALKDNGDIEGINDLAGKKIAVQQGTTSYNEAKNYTTEDLISAYPDFTGSDDGTGIVDDLKSKKFEVIIVDYIQALNLIKNDSELKIVGVPFTKENYGIATKIGNNLLIKEIDSVLKDMEADGHLQDIKTKWTRY